MPSGCVPVELWLVGYWAAANLGLGSARAILLMLVLVGCSLAVSRACRSSDPGSSFQGACEALDV